MKPPLEIPETVWPLIVAQVVLVRVAARRAVVERWFMEIQY